MFKPNQLPLLLGLHITKCAGTSLITTVRCSVSEEAYYFCSSYYHNWLANRVLLADVVDLNYIQFLFGHFCNENLLSVFRDRRIVFFSGIRHPISRVVSHFRHVNFVADTYGQPRVMPLAFLEQHSNSWCREILQCFPSVDQGSDQPLWMKARAAISLFDYLYTDETFKEDARHLLRHLGRSSLEIISANESHSNILKPETEQFVNDGIETIRKAATTYFEHDLNLYEAISPFRSKPNLRQHLSEMPWRIDRDRFVEALPGQAEALDAFSAIERGHLVWEFYSLNKLSELRSHISKRQKNIDLLIDQMQKYGIT